MISALTEYLQAKDIVEAKNILLSNVDDYDFRDLIIPQGYKTIFYEAAQILSMLPLWKVRELGVDLLAWFKDLNWPGVDLIELTLRKLDRNDLMLIIDKGLQIADFEKDFEWIYNINEIFNDILH